MSKINIDRIVSDIKTRSNSLTPVIEAVCNSMDAISQDRTDGRIDIVVKRSTQQSIETGINTPSASIIAIDIIDNGVGFTDENRDSFDTYRSSLKINKGGKGFGRFMYLKYFRHVSVESIYKENGKYKKRSFTFGHGNEIIEHENVIDLENYSNGTQTILHLSSIKENDLDKSLEVVARKLVERLLVFFATGGIYTPIITIGEADGSNTIVLNDYVGDSSDIQQVGETRPIRIMGKNKELDFSVKVYKIYYSAITNKICLTANMREVTESSLHNYVPEFKETMLETDENGTRKNFVIKAYVLGSYLDDNVTTERDGFYFGDDDEEFFELSEQTIYREAAKVAKELFSATINERYVAKKKSVEHYVYSSAPWNKTMLNEIDMENIPIGISDFDLEMLFQRLKFDKEQRARLAINKLIAKDDCIEDSEPAEDIERSIREILDLVTDSQKNDLAHYVCQRKRIIELFDELRKRMDNGKPHKENELHNLFFPMVKNDRQIEYDSNNLWLLDERFNFTQYIASDKVISKVDHREPDLALFYEEGKFYRNGENYITSPVAIVEFKRPKRTNYPDDENPINQALRYAGEILSGKYEMPDGIEPISVDKERTPVYIYIVCDIVEKIEEFARFALLSISPDGQGYFGYNKDYNAYIEIKSFRKVIDDAKMRNQIFFKKLGLL
ncbi:MAG: ATP-binding protein [Bacteroidaceae bacterium]|nr:ATP-binding protein [Bacteroidaceae bacterium]